MKPVTVFSTVAVGAVGAVTASVGLVGPPAAAEPDYPSWSEIEQAKQNESTKQAEIGRLGELLAGLQRSADAAVQTSQMADEAWRQAIDARDRAAERERTLGAQAAEADAVAEISKMRAGLLAAHLARTAGRDLNSELMFGGADAAAADGLLRQLGMASKLGEQSQGVYEQALADRNAADALREQAAEAAEQRERLAGVAEQRADEARSAADAALSAVAEAEVRSTELYAQLATLKDTTADLERSRAEGLAREAAEEALRRAQEQEQERLRAEAEARADAAADAATPPRAGGDTSPAAPAPAPVPAPPPRPAPAPPNSNAVETAIWFARQQLGERYRLGGAGPNVWDCSGLTRAAYAAAGISIGTHSATNQYYTLARRGKAVSLGSIQRGDLLFWGSGGDYYHVAIYLGGGRILEAPREGVPVREYFIWGSPSAAARPA
ncbi:C40 family peptidase [Agromyces neolithicus]|uniref:C40 family peptidase n=1 Tax=Agromyces neolithicus TaxID=269420 RepID=UPI0031D2D746